MSRYFIEYAENKKVAESQSYSVDETVLDGVEFDGSTINYSESDLNYSDDLSFSEQYEVDTDDSLDVLPKGGHSYGMIGSAEDAALYVDDKKIPGTTNYVDDFEEEDEVEEVEEETDWENHRDPKHFMAYINSAYPSGIPVHDGHSTLGCERAILFLSKLNKEISEALRLDADDVLDILNLEEIRIKIVQDIVKLKEHVKKLNKRLNKKSDSENASEIVKEAELEKVASTPRIQMVMTPFERAISGIITNSVVSAGKPLEDVYEFLKKKYSLDEREELAIMQILKDMGHPIFIDRGAIGKPDSKEDKAQGVDFIKNYFA